MIIPFLVLALSFALAFWYLELITSRKKSKEPPGPIPLPIVGDLVTVAKASAIPHEALGILAQKYGEIFKLQMGTVPTVVLASAEAVKSIFTREEGCGRDCRGIFYDRALKQNLGIGFSNGNTFKTTRTWAMKTLKDCGFGRNNTMERTIHDEVRYFLDKFEHAIQNNDGIFHANLQFSIHTLNITWIMFTGSRKEEDDKKIAHLLRASDEFVRAGVFGTGILVAYPFLRYVFPEVTGYNIQMRCTHQIYDLSMEVLHEHKKLFGQYKKDHQNFIDAYLQQMDENKGKPDNVFTEDNFKVMFADLFQGSIETTAGFLEALLLHMGINYDVQQKVQQEIDSIIGDQAEFGMDHLKRMPYTQAVIMETHRHATVLPQFIPHKALSDFFHKKFLIKKDTVIIPATEAINNDKAVFSHPEEFHPENFLDDNGRPKNMDKIFPFGKGGRRCPGQPVAEVIIFIFIATILRSYTVTTVPNEPTPTTKLQLGFTMRPFPYKVLVKPRDK